MLQKIMSNTETVEISKGPIDKRRTIDDKKVIKSKSDFVTHVGKTNKRIHYNRIKKDDLTKIEGIGPKIAGLLNTADIYTFKQLSKTSRRKLKGILQKAGPRYLMYDPSTWSKQAQLADTRKWSELAKLKKKSSGKRRKK